MNDETSPINPIALGARAKARQLRELFVESQALSPSRRDDKDTLTTKLGRATALTSMACQSALEVLESRACTARVAVYLGPQSAINGRPRCRVLVGGDPYTLGCDGIDPGRLRVGQWLELSADGTTVVDADEDPPRDGELVRVARTRPGAGSVAIEVEDAVGPERRRILLLSGFVDPREVTAGALVRARNGFVYEVMSRDAAARQSFLDRCRYHPTGRATFDEIIGQDAAVRRLKMLADSFCFPHLYPGTDPSGAFAVLLEGPPGNGKSFTAEALANQLARTLGDRFEAYLISGGDVKSPWVGESGGQLAELFEYPKNRYRHQGIKSLLIFDEAEGLGRKRSHSLLDTTGVAHDLISTLLPRLSGAQPLEGVCLIFATNFPDSLDVALRRCGRLGGDNAIRLSRLGVDATCRIVRRRLMDRSLAAPADVGALEEALHAALDVTYGTAVVSNQQVQVCGRHLTSGAAADAIIKAANALLCEHIFDSRSRGQAPLLESLTPALLYHGAQRTLAKTLAALVSPGNLGDARAFFAGDLIHGDDAGALSEVRLAANLPSPDHYDLSLLEAA